MSNDHSKLDFPASVVGYPEEFKADDGVANTTNIKVVSENQLLVHDGLVRVSTKENTEKRLSTEQLQDLLQILKKRFDQPNLCRPQGITFADVEKRLKADPKEAYNVYFAEMHLGAEMDYIQYEDGKNYFTDLSIETNVEQQVAFLNSISQKDSEFYERRNEAIKNLYKEYPNIPNDVFDRTPDNKSGPNRWEGELILILAGLKLITAEDYRSIQEKLPKDQWLDIKGYSWLKEDSKAQLEKGIAPFGLRSGHGVRVSERFADFRDDDRGVRVRA